MKITVRNKSNKIRSKAAIEELKKFLIYVAHELRIEKYIKEVRLSYTKDFYGYYPKGKPLGGFRKLYKNGVISISFTKWWDTDQLSRKEAIVHELTHAKQLIEKRLIVHSNGKSLKWNGKTHTDWKMYRDKFREAIKDDSLSGDYIELHFPWEREVTANIKKYTER